MKMSDDGIASLKKFEGCVLTAYPDPGSKDGHPWTIGVGATGPDIKPGVTWTQKQADDRLREDLVKYEAAVNRLVQVPLTQGQFDCLADFAFNVGIRALETSTLLKKLNAGEYDKVPEQLLKWRFNDGKEMPGLVKRRKREVEMWLS